MLSRTADSLYWVSRYVERAEYLARILDATTRLTNLPSAYGGAGTEWQSAVATAGCEDAFALAYDDTTGEVSVVDDRDSSGPTLEICGERYVFRTPRYYLMLELATDDHSFDEIHVQCKAALRIQKPDCVQQISASVKASVTVEADQAFLGSITADTSATVTVLRAVTVGEQTLELVASVYTRGQIIIRGRVAAALCDASASTKGRVEIEKAKEVELRADTYGVVTAKGTKCIKNKFDGGGAITFHRCTH